MSITYTVNLYRHIGKGDYQLENATVIDIKQKRKSTIKKLFCQLIEEKNIKDKNQVYIMTLYCIYDKRYSFYIAYTDNDGKIVNLFNTATSESIKNIMS